MKIKWWIASLVVVIVGLFAWQRFSDPNRELVKKWKAAGVDCLASHQNAALHIHPHLQVFTDGLAKAIPANLGIVTGCMAEVHTHDGSGKIHVESVLAGKELRLKDFFAVWGESLTRPGYNLEMSVDNASSTAGGDLILKDGQEIVLKYIKN